MPITSSRYDGHADWYDAWNQPQADRAAPYVRDLMGPGTGLCLDLRASKRRSTDGQLRARRPSLRQDRRGFSYGA